jgi:hypothetical protein
MSVQFEKWCENNKEICGATVNYRWIKAAFLAGCEAGSEEEAERWSEGLNFLHTEYGADCSGCDSGDPLDCVEVEIGQAIETTTMSAVRDCYQIASSHEFGPDAAKTIRETFGLEIKHQAHRPARCSVS